MKDNYNKLRDLLQELFQLDQADLDFGIYRIMNQKRDEITRFLDKELLPQVKEAFLQYKSADKATLQEELEKAIDGAKALGVNPDDVPKVKELQAKYEASAIDITALENEVFSNLYNFFRRYYHEGDFLSLRRYRKDVYAIPYEGEEVKLHWANHDQYYIKTSEYLRDYTFTLPSGERVHFKLAEANIEKDDIKATDGKERRFVLCETDPLVEKDGELFIWFEYRPDPGKQAQKDLNAQTIETIVKASGFAEWQIKLNQLKASPNNPNRTLLEKHLNDYTARNTFDYFIHKDLGGFLRRELDFYIKNEVMHLDDIEDESVPRVEQYLSKIKVIRKIAHKVIIFLEQLENFQKKLWLKKKFVVETNYCVTLDRVPDELYPEIAINELQRQEWVRMFAINDIEDDQQSPAYSEPLTVEYLKRNPHLVLDTRFYGQTFKDRLLASFDDLSREVDGLVINAENSQALRLIGKRYQDEVDLVFTDPPYNTGSDGFPYKDNYKHSSWLSMMRQTMTGVRRLLPSQGAMFITIDNVEVARLRTLLDEEFGADHFLADIVWNHTKQTKNDEPHFSRQYNHVLCYRKGYSPIRFRRPRTEQDNMNYANPDNDPKGDWRSGDVRSPNPRPTLYEITTPSGKAIKPPPNGWRWSEETLAEKIESGEVIFSEDETRIIRKIYLADQEGRTPEDIWPGESYGTTRSATQDLKDMFVASPFDTPKPKELIQSIMQLPTSAPRVIMDCFAGSGSTAHAAIFANAKDNGKRKYILIEMANYFDTVLKPCLVRFIFSDMWKDGRPLSRRGYSHVFKYVRLESYEDTLNNLELRRTQAQQSLLDSSDVFRESYMLSYLLDVESKSSGSLLNIDSFEDPFNYKLKIATGSAGETKPITIDLAETFNYLIGLTVHHIDAIRGYRVVQGTSPKGEKVLVIWRNLKDKSNEDLDMFFRKQEYNPKDMEFDLIYVNGDNNLENLRRGDETWKVRLIEEEFKRLMFDVQDV